MDRIQEILAKLSGSDGTFEEMSPRDYERWKVENLNKSEGNRHLEDGYHCDLCRNKGYIMKLREMPGEKFAQVMVDCKCAEVRRSILKMKQSGLKDIIKDYTFEKYEAADPWQQSIKDLAMKYAKAPEGWLFFGGQSGIGKTHLCTAVCREFLLHGKQVVYMIWPDDIARMKSLATEPELREKMFTRFKTAEILYIDDLFKAGNNPDGSKQRPTGADIKAAFEIINYRYNNRDMLTIISSKWTQDDLLDIDEATGGRIFERAGGFGINIMPDRAKNYRTRKTVTV